MYAWQILWPSSAVHVYVKFRQTPEGFDPIGYVHFPKLTVPFVAGIVNRDEDQLKTEFPAILEGVNRAFDSRMCGSKTQFCCWSMACRPTTSI
jgi:hypothetical protein